MYRWYRYSKRLSGMPIIAIQKTTMYKGMLISATNIPQERKKYSSAAAAVLSTTETTKGTKGK
jgi:hypothetical protein